MTTLKELNGKVWYRFLKVIFILFYLPYFILLYVVILEGGRDLHDPIIPNTIQETLLDPEFFKLDDYEMKRVLSSIDDKIYINLYDETFKLEDKKVFFKDLQYEQQEQFIKQLKKLPVPTTHLNKKYIYDYYHIWNFKNLIIYSFILTICYILVMECIRRGFYYIVIGKIFPKE